MPGIWSEWFIWLLSALFFVGKCIESFFPLESNGLIAAFLAYADT